MSDDLLNWNKKGKNEEKERLAVIKENIAIGNTPAFDYRHEFEMGRWWFAQIAHCQDQTEQEDCKAEAERDRTYRAVRVSDDALKAYDAGRRNETYPF